VTDMRVAFQLRQWKLSFIACSIIVAFAAVSPVKDSAASKDATTAGYNSLKMNTAVCLSTHLVSHCGHSLSIQDCKIYSRLLESQKNLAASFISVTTEFTSGMLAVQFVRNSEHRQQKGIHVSALH